MPFTKFTNLDFDQIKTSIKDYLRANSNFTDFDFDGSNFSVLIDTLAYNTYITAFNSNMIVNESFLDSATLRENVVSLARNIGYVPRSRSSATAAITFDVPTNTQSSTVTLEPALVCVGSYDNTSYLFSISESITANVKNKVATFGSQSKPVIIYQGSFLSAQFVVNGSLDQKFILENSSIDTNTIRVYVKGPQDSGLGREYRRIDNILKIKSTSEIYLIQEVQDEKYEIIFGDGIFGKKLENGSVVTIRYIVTDGKSGNGPSSFSFQGSLVDSLGNKIIPSDSISINVISSASNGGDIEPISSIKYFAPRIYSSQYRAVTQRDYEAIIQQIYPNTESVSVVGGEELSPPQFGNVIISIKPKNGDYVSDFDKQTILSKLKEYSLTGINQKIVDLKILYIEIDSSIYYNISQVSDPNSLRTSIITSLSSYASSTDINKFGGRFKYSKVLQIIDNTNSAITSNITKVRIRRNLSVILNKVTQYELCFGNKFHINPSGYNIKSTGFYVSGISGIVYLTDLPNKNSSGDLDGSNKGLISIIQKQNDGNIKIISKSAGTVNYESGEIKISTINITSTVLKNNIIEIQAYPESNDVVGLKDLYLYFSIENSSINMVKDVISSGEDISGVSFTRDYFTSSYSNGDLERK
jgi:hypothetical protein